MSRALDSRVKEALENGNHEEVYREISMVLGRRYDKPLEIEFLGHSHHMSSPTSLLQEDNAIAIPKLQLIRAFIVARQKLQAYPADILNGSAQEALEATAVILLMDAEHLTAANTRKRILEAQVAANSQEAGEFVSREKYFIDSLLTSRLHRHTKSPNLWSHRRWLLDRFKALDIPLDVPADLRNVVFVSGERHPRNYYGWCHARYLIILTELDPDVLSTILEDTKKWCFTHHNDISGWMFLLFVLDRSKNRTMGIFGETIKLVESFHWRNESVWYFLRNVVLSESMGGEIPEDFFRVLETFRKGADGDFRRILDKTAVWVEDHSS
ncbi:hypothetical protein ACO1O0_007196 [Amphichorda felina]